MNSQNLLEHRILLNTNSARDNATTVAEAAGMRIFNMLGSSVSA